MVKSRDLETLAANMRKKQTWADIEETLKNDPRILLIRDAMTSRLIFSCDRFCAWMIARCLSWFSRMRLEASWTRHVRLRWVMGTAILALLL